MSKRVRTSCSIEFETATGSLCPQPKPEMLAPIPNLPESRLNQELRSLAKTPDENGQR
jgi:hypothetical protein